MLQAGKIILFLAGLLFIFDAFLMGLHIPNPLFGWPLPCPVTMITLGIGLVLFTLGSKVFSKQ